MPKTSSEPATRYKRTVLHGPAMGTRWSVTVDFDVDVDAGHAVDLAALHQDLTHTVQEVDQQMSPWKPDSDLMRLNLAPVNEWVDLNPEILEVLDCAFNVQTLSAGAFDPCVGELVDAWGFGAARDTPDAQAISAARQPGWLTGRSAVELDCCAGRVRKRCPMQFDLCGIAKGYAVDRMVSVCQQHGVRHALAALDGELRALAAQGSNAPWAVALERPETGQRAVHGVIDLADLAVATSGDYRRYVKVGDAHLAHTMDPRRRAPVNNAVASVTVLAQSCMQADAWATALLVAGAGEGLALAQRIGLDVLFLLRRAGSLTQVGLGRFGS